MKLILGSFVEIFLEIDKTSYFLLLEKNGNRIIIKKKRDHIREEKKMEAKFYEEDKLLIFKITEEIDDYTVQKIRRKADNEMERHMPKRVVFDFDRVTFMDSAGIGMIIGRYKFANMIGANLEVSNLTQNVKKIFEMSGILKLIPIAKDLQAS